MKRRTTGLLNWVGLALVLLFPGFSLGGEGISKALVPRGVTIELTKDFYETLRDEGGRGTKGYSSDPSSEYLRQIAVSTRFMVETNLQILRFQEEIMRLLDNRSGHNRK